MHIYPDTRPSLLPALNPRKMRRKIMVLHCETLTRSSPRRYIGILVLLLFNHNYNHHQSLPQITNHRCVFCMIFPIYIAKGSNQNDPKSRRFTWWGFSIVYSCAHSFHINYCGGIWLNSCMGYNVFTSLHDFRRWKIFVFNVDQYSRFFWQWHEAYFLHAGDVTVERFNLILRGHHR